MKWMMAAVAVAAHVACALRPAPVVAPRISAEQLATRLTEADRLASRGCYLCLKEAAAVYADLLAVSDDATLVRKALENNLMVALREVELRMPGSGAREAAEELQARVPSSYVAYFAALDLLAQPAATGGVSPQGVQENRETRMKLAGELEKEWPASAMKAYFYLAAALDAEAIALPKPRLDAMLGTHSQDLSLRYRQQAFFPLFSMDAARALIGQETGFGEVHFLIGQMALLGGSPGDAFRELTHARKLLPDSASIALVLANVMLSYARYADALRLFESVIASPAEAGHHVRPEAQLGRAKALGYLRRHVEAVAALDELLRDPQNNPGEKYYWRAWNRLQTGETQPAHEDAMAALNVMSNNEVYRLAGIITFGLGRTAEARGYFENALEMNRADCDAERAIGQIDAVERSWKPAFARFSQAIACYDAAIVRLKAQLAGYEQDITGLSNGLIAARRAEIAEAETWRALSAQNADIILIQSRISASP